MTNPTPRVLSINTSPGGIPKCPVESIAITTEGLEGDGHDHEKHALPIQAVCLFDRETLDELVAEGFNLMPGSLGENLTVEGLRNLECAIGDRLRLEGGVELEITKPRKPCYVLDALDPTLQNALQGRSGWKAKVLTPGTLATGETIKHIPAKIQGQNVS